MLPKFKHLSVLSRVFAFLITILPVLPAYAQQTVVTNLSAQQILVNIANQVPALMQMVTAIAYVLGFYFVISGVIKLKHFGESRTMMSQEHSLMPPLIFITVGAMLIYIPTAVQVGMSTFWANPNPYGYVSQSDQWGQFINDCFIIIQFVGVVAFIRGLVILSHVGGHGQPGTFAKGLTHIIGGIFAINIYQTVQVIFVTLGIST